MRGGTRRAIFLSRGGTRLGWRDLALPAFMISGLRLPETQASDPAWPRVYAYSGA